MSSGSRLTLSLQNFEAVADWCGGLAVEEIDPFDDAISRPAMNVPVGDEVKRASIGDTIIHKDDGTFDVQKPL